MARRRSKPRSSARQAEGFLASGERRLFVGLELAAELRESIARTQAWARHQLRSARGLQCAWVAPARFHVTAKFLGGVPESRLSEVADAAARAARGVPPFALE